MKRNKGLVAVIAAGLLFWTTPAIAMGSGNPYEDAQVGLDYVVYQPYVTAGLGLAHFGMTPCKNNHDEQIAARYGSSKRGFVLVENSNIWRCLAAPTNIQGGVRTTLTKSSADMLTGTTISIISIGLTTREITSIVANLKPRYIANHLSK
jgi:hypothetical protein